MVLKNWYNLIYRWNRLNLLMLQHFQLAVKVPRSAPVGADLVKLKKVRLPFPYTVVPHLL
jgi:hypothetical protein